MSFYKVYAVQLDHAFKEARTKYTEAYEALRAAEKRVEDAKHETDFYYKGDADLWREECAAKLKRAQNVFAHAGVETWEDFVREMEEIGKDLKSAFAKVNQARPEDIDRAGLELLNSGILTVDDLGALLDRYEDNPTMRRLIAQHVEKLLKDTKDTQTRRELIAVRQKAAANDIMEVWKNLEDTARICTGQAHGKGEPRYVLSISSQWEKLTENTIKNF